MDSRWLIAGAAAGALALRKRPIDLERFYDDRGCIVTGAGSGFGLEMVRRLHKLKARVLAVDLHGERLNELQNELPGVETLQIDISSPNAHQTILEAAQQHLKRIDLLHNNAGIAVTGPFLQNSAEQIEAMIRINLISHIQLTRAVVPQMIEHGGGDIAFTASLSSWLAAPTLAVYSATKAGVKQFAHALRRELLGTGVRIECLAPNVVKTKLMPADIFEQVEMRYGISETIEALLRGIAKGQRDIFVNTEDRILQRLEQLAPSFIDMVLSRRYDLRYAMERGNVDGRFQERDKTKA